MRLTLVAALAAVLVVACATSPLGRRQIVLVSENDISQAGVTAYKQMQQKMPQSQNTRQVAYVQCIAQNVTAAIPRLSTKGTLRIPPTWEMTVFDSKDINAFAMPGGKMGVFTGLLRVAKTQDQMAAVIGHEISHVLAGHSAERYSDQIVSQMGGAVVQVATGVDGQIVGAAANAFIFLPFSRAHETEADLLGMDLMALAGFDPRQAIALWQNMAKAGGAKPAEILSSHPSDATRMQNLNERLSIAIPLYDQARAQGRRPECG